MDLGRPALPKKVQRAACCLSQGFTTLALSRFGVRDLLGVVVLEYLAPPLASTLYIPIALPTSDNQKNLHILMSLGGQNRPQFHTTGLSHSLNIHGFPTLCALMNVSSPLAAHFALNYLIHQCTAFLTSAT